MNEYFDIHTDFDFGEAIENEFTPELEEWKVQRLGSITGSNFGKLVKSDKRGGYKLSDSKTCQDLIYKIAWERLVKSGNVSNGLGRLSFSSSATNHGNDYEGEAILKYIKETGKEVVYEQQYIKKDEWIGGTPDGFVGEEGLIEVKAPFNGGNHLKTFLTGEIYNTDHFYQIQGYLWITDREWCDYVTYDPDLIEGLQISINRIERDEEVIKAIEEIIEQVKDKIKSIIKRTETRLNER